MAFNSVLLLLQGGLFKALFTPWQLSEAHCVTAEDSRNGSKVAPACSKGSSVNGGGLQPVAVLALVFKPFESVDHLHEGCFTASTAAGPPSHTPRPRSSRTQQGMVWISGPKKGRLIDPLR